MNKHIIFEFVYEKNTRKIIKKMKFFGMFLSALRFSTTKNAFKNTKKAHRIRKNEKLKNRASSRSIGAQMTP